MKKKYAVIDIMKLFFAIFIVLLHSQQDAVYYPVLDSFQGIIWLFFTQIISRIAVPFFFVTSSYFLYSNIKKNGNEKKCVFSYCKRILILYIIWFMISFIYILIFKLGFPNNMSFKLLIKLFRDIILGNGFPASWFLMASVIDVLVIYCLNKLDNGRDRLAWIVSIICYIICLLMTYYNFLVGDNVNYIFTIINKVWGYFYISFPYGLIYFMLGKFMVEIQSNCKVNKKYDLCGLIISLIFLTLEVFVTTYYIPNFNPISRTTYLFLPIVSFFLVKVCLNSELKYKTIYLKFRNISTIIYCLHATLLHILSFFIKSYFLFSLNLFLVLFISVTLSCILLSVIIIKLSKRYKFLLYLY